MPRARAGLPLVLFFGGLSITTPAHPLYWHNNDFFPPVRWIPGGSLGRCKVKCQ